MSLKETQSVGVATYSNSAQLPVPSSSLSTPALCQDPSIASTGNYDSLVGVRDTINPDALRGESVTLLESKQDTRIATGAWAHGSMHANASASASAHMRDKDHGIDREYPEEPMFIESVDDFLIKDESLLLLDR